MINNNSIEISQEIDNMPISPEAFRVYFSILCHVKEHGEFPFNWQITDKCFDKRYALRSTHTDRALKELIKFQLIQGEPDSYTVNLPVTKHWDESIARQQRVESIVELAIYSDRHPDDYEAKKCLQSEFQYWEDRYGELGLQSLHQWKKHWTPVLDAIEIYEDEIFSEEE